MDLWWLLNNLTFYHLDNEQLINKGYDMEIPDNIIANKIISNKENNQEPMNKENLLAIVYPLELALLLK